MGSEKYNIDGYRNLAVAVVIQAEKDYRIALKRLYRHPADIEAKRIKKDCERFFQNEIGMYTDLDGDAIMYMIRQRADKECDHHG